MSSSRSFSLPSLPELPEAHRHRCPPRQTEEKQSATPLTCSELFAARNDLETSFPDRSLPATPVKRPTFLMESKFFELEDTDSDSDLGLKTRQSLLLPHLDTDEKKFLELVYEDDVDGAQTFVSAHPAINVNCINFRGQTALHIAVVNRSTEMVIYLLTLKDIDIGDCVLHAVRADHRKILGLLLDYQRSISPGLEFAGAAHSSEFPQYMTPLMLAAHCGHYQILSLLMDRGHHLKRPHPVKCQCINCIDSRDNDDPIEASHARLALYQAICSPEYIIHVASDPILVAFRLTSELHVNAKVHRQQAAAYMKLRDDLGTFTVDLIDEVELILRQTSGSRYQLDFVFPRLLMAMDLRKKEFVAHPNTQQILDAYWIGNWYSWRSKSKFYKSIIIGSRVFMVPGMYLMCLFLPKHRLVKHLQIPLNKLITHVTAYFVFLILVFIISNRDKTAQKRGPPDTGVELPLIAFVCGDVWSMTRMCLLHGPRRYFHRLRNWGKVMMVILFILTFILWAVAANEEISDCDRKERKYWSQYDPTLLAEGTFCVATIIAYFRLMFLCQLNYHLGPLQDTTVCSNDRREGIWSLLRQAVPLAEVSLGKMTIDIYKYSIVFAIVMCAFAAGLARLYQYYDGMIFTDESGMKTVQVSSFTSLPDTLNTLFWALFCMAPIESADVVVENVRLDNNTVTEIRHGYTEKIGYLCFACFEVITVIVVLNMLIATMSSTFHKVCANVSNEWTFGRTELYLDYITQTTLPSPFNLLPTGCAIVDTIEWFMGLVKRPKGSRVRWTLGLCCFTDRDKDKSLKDFPMVMSHIAQRYFREKNNKNRCNVLHQLETIKRNMATLKSILYHKRKPSN